jgi:hypothetical protein
MATLKHREGEFRIYELENGTFEVRRAGVVVGVCDSLAGAKMLIRLIKRREAIAAAAAQRGPGAGGPA